MTIEVSLLLTGISVAFAIFFGMSNQKRSQKADVRSDVELITTLNVRLESISVGITDIKNELSNVKADIKEHTEKIIILEQKASSAHKRLDEKVGKGEMYE